MYRNMISKFMGAGIFLFDPVCNGSLLKGGV